MLILEWKLLPTTCHVSAKNKPWHRQVCSLVQEGWIDWMLCTMDWMDEAFTSCFVATTVPVYWQNCLKLYSLPRNLLCTPCHDIARQIYVQKVLANCARLISLSQGYIQILYVKHYLRKIRMKWSLFNLTRTYLLHVLITRTKHLPKITRVCPGCNIITKIMIMYNYVRRLLYTVHSVPIYT